MGEFISRQTVKTNETDLAIFNELNEFVDKNQKIYLIIF